MIISIKANISADALVINLQNRFTIVYVVVSISRLGNTLK